MLMSLALIFTVGLLFAAICEKLKLPRIIGMIAGGVLLGPFALNLLDSSVLGISAELRQMALVIILIKAGLSLDLSDLKKVGRPAVLLSFVPASFEILGYFLLASVILGVSPVEAALMGAVMGAVSPAVVVPRMIKLTEQKRGTKKGIPQMILAGSSLDDIFVITVFYSLLGTAKGEGVSPAAFADIPISILLGASAGAAVGYCLAAVFERAHWRGRSIRSSIKIIIVLAFSFFLVAAENLLKGSVPISGTLGVMSMACVLKIKSRDSVSKGLSDKFGKLWIAAEIILFVLVGAAVDVRYTSKAGAAVLIMIFAALLFRAVGVAVCLFKTPLNFKERIFCMASYLPKATVQAAIGSVPLAAGLSCGNTVLSTAVVGIIITAPVGAFLIDFLSGRLLQRDGPQ